MKRNLDRAPAWQGHADRKVRGSALSLVGVGKQEPQVRIVVDVTSGRDPRLVRLAGSDLTGPATSDSPSDLWSGQAANYGSPDPDVGHAVAFVTGRS